MRQLLEDAVLGHQFAKGALLYDLAGGQHDNAAGVTERIRYIGIGGVRRSPGLWPHHRHPDNQAIEPKGPARNAAPSPGLRAGLVEGPYNEPP